MKKRSPSRRDFIKKMSMSGLTLALSPGAFFNHEVSFMADTKKVGIIGLDTSHSIEFTRILNHKDNVNEFLGYQVACAYPLGSPEVGRNAANISKYTEEIKEYGVKIVSSIEELLSEVNVVFLETNDGRLHLDQAIAVFKAGKPLFIDKPLAQSLTDVLAIYKEAEKYHIPVFSSSALRYTDSARDVAAGGIGKVTGADVFSPAYLEKNHTSLFWYGIHGVETLFTIMGTGCESVTCIHSDDTDVVAGKWKDGRLGTFRGLRSGKTGFGGIAFGEKGIMKLSSFPGYRDLVFQIISFFDSGKSPVTASETIEIYAFMEAADESMRKGGLPVSIGAEMQKARKNLKIID